MRVFLDVAFSLLRLPDQPAKLLANDFKLPVGFAPGGRFLMPKDSCTSYLKQLI